MPRYFFHVLDGRDIPDDEGVVLAGPDDARAEAVSAAGALLGDLGGRFWQGPDWRMRITDESGATVCELRITGATAVC